MDTGVGVYCVEGSVGLMDKPWTDCIFKNLFVEDTGSGC